MSDVIPLSTFEIMEAQASREFILLGGKDSVGKTSAIISMASYVEATNPSAKFYIIDTENKVRSILRSFGADAPKNIAYYLCTDMNQVTSVVAKILKEHTPGDWLGVESLGRVWEKAQDLGYQSITGQGKADYMETRREFNSKKDKNSKMMSPTPQPDQLWNIVKGAHDGAFFDLLTGQDTLNVICSTPTAKPKDEKFFKENADRKAIRIEHGIDANLEGAPRIPYYVETLVLMTRKDQVVTAQVVRDNHSTADDTRPEFIVSDKKSFGVEFHATCRS